MSIETIKVTPEQDIRFWIVVNDRTGPSVRPKRHFKLEDAKHEANRIAATHAGDLVYILESVGHAQSRNVTWTAAQDHPHHASYF